MIPTEAKHSYPLHHIPDQWRLLPVELKRCHLSKKLSFFPPIIIDNWAWDQDRMGPVKTHNMGTSASIRGWWVGGWRDYLPLGEPIQRISSPSRDGESSPMGPEQSLYLPLSVYLWAPKWAFQQQTLLASLTGHDKYSQRIRLALAARGLTSCHLHFPKVWLRKSAGVHSDKSRNVGNVFLKHLWGWQIWSTIKAVLWLS